MATGPRLLMNFTPTYFAGCVIWLRADQGVTVTPGKVSAWADMSGNGTVLSQGTDSNRPTAPASDTLYNGQKSIQLGGASYLSSSVGITLGSFTEFHVGQRSAAAGYISVVNSDSSTPVSYFFGSDNNTGVVTRAGGQTAIKDVANWHVTSKPSIAVRTFNGTHASHTFRLNGKLRATTAASSNDPTTSVAAGTLYLYANQAGASGSVGSFAEHIIYNRLLTSAEINQVECYLSERYGIPLP